MYQHNTTEFTHDLDVTSPATWDLIEGVPPSSPATIHFWDMMRVIRWPTILWGIGTAIGELPPYFIAYAAAGTQNNKINLPPTTGMALRNAGSHCETSRIVTSI